MHIRSNNKVLNQLRLGFSPPYKTLFLTNCIYNAGVSEKTQKLCRKWKKREPRKMGEEVK